MSFASVFQALGWIILIFSIGLLPPALIALFDGQTDLAWTFIASAGLAGFVGAALAAATRGSAQDFGRHESFLFVVLAWPALAAFGALPFYFAEAGGSVIAAYFEATSGLTTTGATLINGLESVPSALLLWRALLQGIGGFFTIVVAVVVLSSLAVGGGDLLSSAIPRGEGASIPQRMAQVARELSWIYLALLTVCAALLWLAGMAPFEAICHALSTVSTGGFSTRDGGIAAFDSWYVEIVLTAFMVMGALNFTLHWALFNGRTLAYRHNPEWRYFFYATIAGVLLMTIAAVVHGGAEPTDAARIGVFAAVSALSTTGYSSAVGGADGLALSPMLVIALVLVGGSAASTSGGLKLFRLAVLLKQALRELRRLTHPHAVVRVRLADLHIDDGHIWAVWSFFFIFILTIAATALILALDGLETSAAIAAAVATLANAGPAMHLIDPSAPPYGEFSAGVKLVLVLVMVMGRVELLTFFVLLNPSYWRN